MQPQSHFVWRGLEVAGCTRGATPKIVNGVRYVVDTFDPSSVTLRLHPDFVANTSEEEDEVVLPTVRLQWEEYTRLTRLTHVLPYCYF